MNTEFATQVPAIEQLPAAEANQVKADFDKLIGDMQQVVPAETREMVNSEYAGKDPGGSDFNCFG